MRWRAFYSDGSSYSSQDGIPASAPGWGVQAIAQEDETCGVLVHQGSDFYVWDRELFGGWGGIDMVGLTQYLSEPGHKVIKLGQLIPTARWREIVAQVRDDPELPEKSAWYPSERVDA